MTFQFKDSDTLALLEKERLRHLSDARDYKYAIKFQRNLYMHFYPTLPCFGRGRQYIKDIARDNLRLRNKSKYHLDKADAIAVYIHGKRNPLD